MASATRGATLRATGPDVVRVAVAIVVPFAVGLLGLMMLGSAEWIERMACQVRLLAPCPGTASLLTIMGATGLIAGMVGMWLAFRFIRSTGHARLVLPALSLIFSALAAYALVNGEGLGNALMEFGGFAAGSAVLSLGLGTSRLLRAAVLAQVVDLATFGPVWQLGAGEANPIGRLLMDALAIVDVHRAEDTWLAATIAGGILILAKLALIGFLIRVTPYLQRYRRPVLVAATAAGSIGAAANLLVIL